MPPGYKLKGVVHIGQRGSFASCKQPNLFQRLCSISIREETGCVSPGPRAKNVNY